LYIQVWLFMSFRGVLSHLESGRFLYQENTTLLIATRNIAGMWDCSILLCVQALGHPSNRQFDMLYNVHIRCALSVEEFALTGIWHHPSALLHHTLHFLSRRFKHTWSHCYTYMFPLPHTINVIY
jgi:hypothetical protein